MLIAILALACLACVPLIGGHYRALSNIHLRGGWLVTGALAVQIMIISVFDLRSEALARSLHVSTYLLIGVVIALNWSLQWLPVIAVGWLCNFVVIVANAGIMPTSSSAARTIGRHVSGQFENSTPTANAHLAFLGDNIATPRNWPMANILSVGDVVLLIGFALVIWTASRPTTRPI